MSTNSNINTDLNLYYYDKTTDICTGPVSYDDLISQVLKGHFVYDLPYKKYYLTYENSRFVELYLHDVPPQFLAWMSVLT